MEKIIQKLLELVIEDYKVYDMWLQDGIPNVRYTFRNTSKVSTTATNFQSLIQTILSFENKGVVQSIIMRNFSFIRILLHLL